MRLILYIILLFPFVLSAQDRTIDSLKLALKNAKHDTTRCDILSELAETASDEEWPLFNEQLLKQAEKGMSSAAMTSTPKSFYLKHIGDALNNIAFLAQNHGDISKALEYYHKSLKIREEIKDKEGISASLNNIGAIYDNHGDILKALEYYHKSLKIQEEIKDKKGIAISLNNIGGIYDSQGDIPKALEYYHKSLKIDEESQNKQGIAGSLNNIGGIYINQGDITKALEYFHKSLKFSEEINSKEGIAHSLSNLGFIYNNQGDITKALEYWHKSLKFCEEIKNKEGISHSLYLISNAMLQMDRVGEAFRFANRSLMTAKELGSPENIKPAAKTLKNIYKKQSNYKQALEMYELEIAMRDSINNADTKKASIKKQFQYEYEKKAAADSVKHAEEQKVKNALLTAQQAQLKQEKTQRIALYGGLVLVLAFSGFVFNRFRVTQKQKIIIEQQKVLVDEAYTHLEEKNKEVLDSIHYAKRIQTALLTSEKYIERKLNELIS